MSGEMILGECEVNAEFWLKLMAIGWHQDIDKAFDRLKRIFGHKIDGWWSIPNYQKYWSEPFSMVAIDFTNNGPKATITGMQYLDWDEHGDPVWLPVNDLQKGPSKVI